jgi:hypothetical protein
MKTSVVKASIIGGVVGIVLTLLSSLSVPCVGYLGYLVAIGVGALAVYFSEQSLTVSQGAVDGAIAGAIAGIVDGVVGAIVGLLRIAITASKLGVPGISPAAITGSSIVPVIGGMIAGVGVAVILGALGGAVSAAVQGRT